jgi:alpha-1,2-mannosyltransferase
VSHYAAGEMLREDRGQLYSLPAQRQYQAALGAKKFLPWVHPAVEALLFAPLTWMGIESAFRVWEALNLVALCAIAFGLRRFLGELTGAQMGAVFAAGAIPLGAGLGAGQDHILCLALYVWAFLLMEDGRDGLGGLVFGLTFVRFQLALPVLVLFVVLQRWRVVAGAMATVMLMVAGSFALVGRGLVPSYRAALGYLGMAHDASSVTRMPSVRGLLAFVVKEPRELAVVAAVVSGVVLIVAAVMWRRADERRFDLLFGSALLFGLAVDYHAFLYELSVVVLAGVLIVRKYPRFAVWLWVMGAAEVALVPMGGRFSLLAPMLVAAGWWAAWRARTPEAPGGVCRPGLIPSH